ncbi:hypothetical protein GE061_000359 [Apolygus lucorum]|uniref:Ig-like domain-containing protein n=1 Tax=Apolygus lucorum TaxID=248454 RepID=A0A8S9Y417_APOLU|nr:hypothetical protein GE061_000359 [Apolygus lucorum]
MTVPAGRPVRMSCAVKNLGQYKVAWMHFEQSAILAVHSHVITRNPRITVSNENHNVWNLHIADVKEEDGGTYMCQINTATAKTQLGYLNVVVPPDIEDALSSSDMITREGSNVTLTCSANGSPSPTIRWRRDDSTNININKTLSVSEWEGNTLELTRISRLDMGAYLCIASNGVPPSVSKRIRLNVDWKKNVKCEVEIIFRGDEPEVNRKFQEALLEAELDESPPSVTSVLRQLDVKECLPVGFQDALLPVRQLDVKESCKLLSESNQDALPPVTQVLRQLDVKECLPVGFQDALLPVRQLDVKESCKLLSESNQDALPPVTQVLRQLDVKECLPVGFQDALLPVRQLDVKESRKLLSESNQDALLPVTQGFFFDSWFPENSIHRSTYSKRDAKTEQEEEKALLQILLALD